MNARKLILKSAFLIFYERVTHCGKHFLKYFLLNTYCLHTARNVTADAEIEQGEAKVFNFVQYFFSFKLFRFVLENVISFCKMIIGYKTFVWNDYIII